MKKKVIVGMSGGVDSSVTAMLMLEEGHIVEGATMLLGEHSWPAIKRAQEICNKMGIKHHIVDLAKVFKEKVIDFFIEGYESGKTPLPCAECNKNIKFHEMIEFTKSQEADYFATGHYIRTINNNGTVEIHRAKDLKKDQTHFIFHIDKKVLPMIKFPLGDMIKSDVKELAKKLNLGLDTQKESQDICFLEGKSYTDFFQKNNIQIARGIKKGDIVHISTGDKLGEHMGAIRYTIGQRKGLGVAYSEPLYVIRTDLEKNVVYVGEEKFLMNNFLKIKELNFLDSYFEMQDEFEIDVCLRALKPLISARVNIVRDRNGNIEYAKVFLSEMDRAITDGQACVFYRDNRLIGGGWIDNLMI